MIVSSLDTGQSHCRPSILSLRSEEDITDTDLVELVSPLLISLVEKRLLRCYSSVLSSLFQTCYFPLLSGNTEGNIETGNRPNPQSTLYFSRSSAD